jgi:hypothetical protein
LMLLPEKRNIKMAKPLLQLVRQKADVKRKGNARGKDSRRVRCHPKVRR